MKKQKYPELSKIKGKITEKGMSYRKLCKAIGISLNCINDKLNGYSLFYIDEAVTICKILDIPISEIPYFFECDVV